MNTVRFWLVAMVLAVVCLPLAAGEKERLMFQAKPAESYPARDEHEGVIVAVEPFEKAEESKAVFGKNDPGRVGIVPVLLVIANRTDKTLRLDDLKVQFIARTREKVEPIEPDAVMGRMGKKVERGMPGPPSPIPRISVRKDAGALEVLVHAFNMRMVPPNGTASGFLYFDLGEGHEWLPGGQLFVNNLRWANSGQELLYFELDMDKSLAARSGNK